MYFLQVVLDSAHCCFTQQLAVLRINDGHPRGHSQIALVISACYEANSVSMLLLFPKHHLYTRNEDRMFVQALLSLAGRLSAYTLRIDYTTPHWTAHT